MFSENPAAATIAVKDIKRAKEFYEKSLGLKPVDTGEGGEEGVLTYKSGGADVLVYESEFAGTNKATSATWTVNEDIGKLVSDLKAKGVRFEHYDMPGVRHEGDLHVDEGGHMKCAWFKDPDGNILGLVSG